MEANPTRVNELLVGLGDDVEVVGVTDEPGRPLRVVVQLRSPRPVCGSCDGAVWSNGARRVEPGGPRGVRAAGSAGVAKVPLALPQWGLCGGDVH